MIFRHVRRDHPTPVPPRCVTEKKEEFPWQADIRQPEDHQYKARWLRVLL